MGKILHQLLIEASPEQVYQALTQQEGLGNWWTKEVKAEAKVGSVAEFSFYGRSIVTKFYIEQLDHARLVRWRCVDGPPEYIASIVLFELTPTPEGTRVGLSHERLNGSEEFLQHAEGSWAYVLNSLKLYMETGAGTPFSG